MAGKRFIAFILTVFAGITTLTAQTHYSANISLGGHGGVDLSRVMFTPGIDQSFLPGGTAGVGFRYIEENHFGLIAELNWAQRGWKEDFEDEPFEYSRTTDFIEIPLLAHIYFGRRGRFFINAGPSVSFFLGERTKANFDYENISSVPNFPVRITYQYTMPVDIKVDFGICGGIGGEFSINRNNAIYLEARYYFGLTNLVNADRGSRIRGANPMTLSITAGYWFRVK